MIKNNSLKTRAIKCPSCAGTVEFQLGHTKASCPYCGNDVVIDDPGWFGELDKYELKLRSAQVSLDSKEWLRAQEGFEACLKIDDTDPRAWKGVIEAKTRCLNSILNTKTEGNFNCYLKRSSLGENDPFVERYRAYMARVADMDASNGVSNAKVNILYYNKNIEIYQGTLKTKGDDPEIRKIITNYEKCIQVMNKYIGIDRKLRIDMFLKQHLDAAGLSNDIVVDESLTEIINFEKTCNTLYSGYKKVTSYRAFQ